MWRVALIRGLASGSITAGLGLSKLHGEAGSPPPANYNEFALLIAGISGFVAITVALITVIGPAIMRRYADRDPSAIAARAEATDALAEALVESNRRREEADARAAKAERQLKKRGDDGPE